MLLGYLYFRLAGEAYALVSIGLISFAAVAQFAPAMLGGLYWKGGTQLGALVGLCAGFALWVYTLLLPSFVKSGWLPAALLSEGPWGIALLKPEQLLGLAGLDSLTHSLFWSLLANAGAYVVVSLVRAPSGQEASQALLFVDIFERSAARVPVFWRGRARVPDLLQLAGRFLGAERARQLIDDHLRSSGAGPPGAEPDVADARLVQLVETQLAGAIGSASARVMVASVVEEEPLALDDVMRMLEETSQLRAYSHELEDKSQALERATAELRTANEELLSLDRLKDDFMASVTHELRTPLAAIRAVTELMRDDAEMPAAQREAFLDIVVTETERLGRLVNQVLDMAKIESGHGEWHNVDVDMRELLAQAVQTTAAMFRERGATVHLHLPRCAAHPARRPRPAAAGADEPVVERGQVPAARGWACRPAAASRRCRRHGGGAGQRARRGAGPAGPHLREVPPGRRRSEPSAGNRPGLADQPPDRRAFRWPHVAAIGTGAWRLLRILPALVRCGAERRRGPRGTRGAAP